MSHTNKFALQAIMTLTPYIAGGSCLLLFLCFCARFCHQMCLDHHKFLTEIENNNAPRYLTTNSMSIQFSNPHLKNFIILSLSVLGIMLYYKIMCPSRITQPKKILPKKDDDLNPFYFDPGDSDLGPILV